MTVKDIAGRAAAEAARVLEGLDEAQAGALADAVARAPRVFTAGAGRSGLIMKCFAMRLMHLGLTSYVVGECVTPSAAAGDLLVIGSGSGSTGSLVAMAQRAKELGMALALITTRTGSPLADLADCLVVVGASSKQEVQGERPALQPMANVFEQCLLLLTDGVSTALMEGLGESSDGMYKRHANLE